MFDSILPWKLSDMVSLLNYELPYYIINLFEAHFEYIFIISI